MICNCGFKADNREEFENHINSCKEVGTEEWEAKNSEIKTTKKVGRAGARKYKISEEVIKRIKEKRKNQGQGNAVREDKNP